MPKLTDREKIEFLRSYIRGIGHTDGTPFGDATVESSLVMPHDYIKMSEVVKLIDYYLKLPTLVSMGHVISPPENFVYWMLKDSGLLDAFAALHNGARNA